MVFNAHKRSAIIDYVKQEPCTVQDIAQHIGVSWVTAERYVNTIIQETGELQMKVFREGTRGALKIVYHVSLGASHRDELEKTLYTKIRSGRFKHHFDFLEIYQYIPTSHKTATIWNAEKHPEGAVTGLKELFRQANTRILIHSGNLSFIHEQEEGTPIATVLEECLERGVQIKIIARINVATINALETLHVLLAKYPSSLEIHHAYQPLRGFIIDNKIARFKDDENQEAYRSGELDSSLSIYYEVRDEQWVSWLTRVFWNLWRTSIEAKKREDEIKNIRGSD